MTQKEVTYKGEQFTLRAGSPMPCSDGTQVLHTFMAEKNKIVIYAYTTSIVGSNSFRGQGGTLISANYSRLPDIGGDIFQGKTVETPSYVDEDLIN